MARVVRDRGATLKPEGTIGDTDKLPSLKNDELRGKIVVLNFPELGH